MSAQSVRKKYTPSLTQLSALAETNYVRLQKLLPNDKAGTQVTFSLRNGSHKGMHFSVRIDEIHKYTTMLTFSQNDRLTVDLDGVRLQIRMYHDAGMAEVIRYQGKHVVEGVHQYPNPAMYQPDEKTRLNGFLAECLEHCLTYGCAEIPVWLTAER